MGFSTSLHFWLDGPIPVIKCGDLARFAREFSAIDVVREEHNRTCEIKFGWRIDKNHRPLNGLEPVPGTNGMISRCVTQRLSMCERDIPTLDGMSRFLETRARRRTYRAYVSLGGVTREFFDRVYQPVEGDGRPVRLDTWSLRIDPIILTNVNSMNVFEVGFVSVTLAGEGLCYPRTLRQVVDAVRAQPETQRVEALCRRFWPVKPLPAPAHRRNLREKLRDRWPYDSVDQPAGWYWSVSQDG